MTVHDELGAGQLRAAFLSRDCPLRKVEPFVRVSQFALKSVLVGFEPGKAFGRRLVQAALDSLRYCFPQSRERKRDETGEEHRDHRDEDGEGLFVHLV